MIDPRFYTLRPPIPLGELIEGLAVDAPDGKWLDELIKAPAALAESQAGQISFFKNKRHKDRLQSAGATACFVPEKLASQVGERQIITLISKHPRAHFARVCTRLVNQGSSKGVETQISSSATIHPTAIIGDGAIIGEGVRIGPYVVIGDGVEIGDHCEIDPHAHIQFTKIGPHGRVKSGAVVGGSGFGVAQDEIGIIDIPHLGRVILGARVSIGAQSCIDRGQLGDTVLGNDVKLDNFVQIAHNCQVGDGTMMAAHVGISGSCIIGKNCQFGGRVGLADHITIGDGAILAASAGAMHDIPAGEMYSGIPAIPIREHMRVISATRKLAKKT